MTVPEEISPKTDAPGLQSSVVGRRRKLITGAGAGFLVLGSKSVLGAECYNPSETLSGTRSHTNGDMPVCNGRSPGIWWQAALAGGRQGGVNWYGISPSLPGNGLSTKPWDTLFSAVFPYGSYFSGKTLLQVMEAHQNGGGDLPGNLGFHIIGALLNIRAGLVDPRALTESYLVHTIWAEFVGGGYHPTASVTWGAEEIVDYLKSTSIAP